MSEVLDIAVRLVVIVVVFLALPLIVGQMEHKAMAHMQSRLGPSTPGVSTAGPSSSPTA